MKKLKLGFTIAEVATSMAVIGVVAALLMPQVVKNVQRAQAGPILGRAVEQITLGNQNIIEFANMNSAGGSQTNVLGTIRERDLNPGSETNNFILDNLSFIAPIYWGANNEDVPVQDIKSIKNFDNSNADAEDADDDFSDMIVVSGRALHFSKIPAGIAVYSSDDFEPSIEIDADTSKIIFIDTNGWSNSPNTFGKDIFAFHLLNSGKLKPFNEDDADNGLEYTEQVIRDNFRITYN